MKTKTQKEAPVIEPEELEMDNPVCETEESDVDINDAENVEASQTFGESYKAMFGTLKRVLSSLADEAQMHAEDDTTKEEASTPEMLFEHEWQNSLNRITTELREAFIDGDSDWSIDLPSHEYQEMQSELADLIALYPFDVSIETKPDNATVVLKADFDSYENPIKPIKWIKNMLQSLEDREAWEESLDNLVNPLINFIGKVADVITKEESFEPVMLKSLMEDAYENGVPMVSVIMDKYTYDEVKSFVQLAKHNLPFLGDLITNKEGRLVNLEIGILCDDSFALKSDIPIYPLWNEDFKSVAMHDLEKLMEHFELAITDDVTEIYLCMPTPRYNAIKRKLALRCKDLRQKLIISADERPDAISVLKVQIFD